MRLPVYGRTTPDYSTSSTCYAGRTAIHPYPKYIECTTTPYPKAYPTARPTACPTVRTRDYSTGCQATATIKNPRHTASKQLSKVRRQHRPRIRSLLRLRPALRNQSPGDTATDSKHRATGKYSACTEATNSNGPATIVSPGHGSSIRYSKT